jgi:hypothetical protein
LHIRRDGGHGHHCAAWRHASSPNCSLYLSRYPLIPTVLLLQLFFPRVVNDCLTPFTMAQETEHSPSQPTPPKSMEELQVALQRADQARSYAIGHAVELVKELRELCEACTKEKECMQQTHQAELKELENILKDIHDIEMRVLIHENPMLRWQNESLQVGEDDKKAKLHELKLEKQKSSKYSERDKATIRSLKERYSVIQGERNGLDHSEMSLTSTADDTM